ncbi:MAG: hypothetical protein SOU84_00385 [Candidatus Faecimonas sp.]|nr:hypothetical protein [Mycoplasmatota bacterium]MDY2907610.1 hypothetical protein [Candidatus Faecimonas sp.]
MDTFIRFLYEFMSVFFNGLLTIFKGIASGFIQMFNFSEYLYIIQFYKNDFEVSEWILVIIAIVVLAILLGLIIVLLWLVIRKYIRFRKTLVEQESMLNEIGELNKKVASLVKEKEDILAMKVSQLGLKPDEANIISEEENPTKEGEDPTLDEDESKYRFSKLHAIDLQYRDYKVQVYNNTFTLEELVEEFRNFAASKLKLYYTTKMIRLFISALSATKLVILQGISGTGKTSLAYAWGKFIKRDAIIASVQPSWRDRTELFGYFNEFTKKFNETDVLKGMYIAGYTDDVYVTVLDEMNIARVEYYFAEMLSILEMPSRDEWVIELVPSSWDTDPKKLKNGKLQIPGNMWYIGTINNDDSTFAVTDKVYDRAMPIDINDKGQPFTPTETEAMNINSSYLEGLFAEAKQKHPLSEEMEQKINEMDDYVIKHFRIAFGNRIVKQMRDFVATYVECGGTEVDGVDYYIARKILRKFEQLNLAYIRDEIDGFVEFLNKEFGKDNFTECKDYLLRLKKLV